MLNIKKTGVYDSTEHFKNIKQTPERITEYYEIELYISGEGETYIDSVGYKHEKGNLVFAKPGQKRYSLNKFMCYSVHLETDENTAKLLQNIPNIMKITDRSAYIICFNEIISIYGDNSGEMQLLLQSKLFELLHMIKREAELQKRKGQNDKTDAKQMKKAVEFIEENFSLPIALKDIANSVHLSPVYFHKLFKIYTGKTPAEFLLNKRISAAKIFLLTTDLTMEEIAEKCGFSSLAYFDYKFKCVCGITPSEYRRQKYAI